MLTRRRLLAALAVAFAPAGAAAHDHLHVVASFSILGDLVAAVGGERVDVTTLVGPDGDAHVYQPTPADAKAVAEADLVVVNGLGFEGWIDRLIAASGYRGPVVVAAARVAPLASEEAGERDPGAAHDHDHAHDHAHDHDHAAQDHAGQDHAGHDHGPVDPHAWQSATNAALYVNAIAEALTVADPEGAAIYAANRATYLAELDALDAEIRAAAAALPPERRTVVTSHDAFGYFERDYGLRFVAPQGISTEAEASAQDVARLIGQIRAERIPAVFVETIADPRLLEQIRRETGAGIGGALYSDALSPPDGPAPTYLRMMRHNLATLTAALGS